MKAKHCVVLMAAMVVLLTIVAPARASVTDDQIVSSAKQSYIFTTFLKGDDIKIESKDGVVTLTGVVSGSIHKQLAEETLAYQSGVKSVDNRLTVKGAAPTANSDAWLQEKVQATLSFHRSTSASSIEVSVKNGKATLRGNATSQAQKDLATEYAKDVDGVKGVDNQMIVSSKTPAVKAAENIDDASITVQVKLSLLHHRSASALNTKVAKVQTEKGVVTLQGRAKTEAQRTLITNIVADINGVKSVNNQMTIE